MLSTDSDLTAAFKTSNSAFSCNSQCVEASAIQEQPQPAVLSGKQRRACLKKERRKRKRQALAKLESHNVDQPEIEQDPEDDKEDEELREQLHQEWLARERIAQEEFRLKKEKEEAACKRKDEEERRIRKEWEDQQRKEKEVQEQKQQQRRDREQRKSERPIDVFTRRNEAVQKLLDQAENQLENGSWKNPDAPVDYGTEKDKANCPFFLKTGACRFGDRCSRRHNYPLSSTTMMVRSMFVTYAMEQSRRDDYDTDASLEYGEEELQQQFLDFYEDVLSEFKNAGKVIQFKVSCNFEPHLRGNVYIQYDTEDQCKEAFRMFNGRWYAGRQLQCEFCPVTKWKTAICGLFDRQRCPKGKHCNFLHVFRNPSNEFWEADRDLHLSPDRGGGFTGRHRMTSQRGYSPEQCYYRRSDRRSRSHEKYIHRRWRSRSRERRSRSRSRESRRSQHSQRRRQSSWNDRGRSRSRERRRSRSRGRETDCQSGDHLKNSGKISSRKSESDLLDEKTKNRSVKRKSRKSRSKSPQNGDTNASSHHHKHSKKNKRKKKSKKKQKAKRNKSSSSSSSAASSRDSLDDEEEEIKRSRQKKSIKPAEESEITEALISLQDNAESQEKADVCQSGQVDSATECGTTTLLRDCT